MAFVNSVALQAGDTVISRSPTSGYCREVHANNFKVRREDLLRPASPLGPYNRVD